LCRVVDMFPSARIGSGSKPRTMSNYWTFRVAKIADTQKP